MENQKIIEKAIHKAIDGGWKFKMFMFEYEYPNFKQTWNGNIIVATSKTGTAVTINFLELLLNHDFANALWGREHIQREWPLNSYAEHPAFGDSIPRYKYHLQQMVIADDPIKYLGENI